MASSPDSHAHTRDDKHDGNFQVDAGQAGQRQPEGVLTKLFSLPNGDSVSFLLHNFENVDLTKRIILHGGRITDRDHTADVILTISRDEYRSLKDRYAISRKTHVRMSGFVDRCVNSRRFRLAPVVEKGVPGRRRGSRRVQFTADDDEHLCQYIAEVLPDEREGGRTGHFIYADLLRRADEFGQYSWAHRHPKDGWRQRYRKNQNRLDARIAEIVKEAPPSPDGKGRYMSRRYGKIDELNAEDDELTGLYSEERSDSAADNYRPVQTRSTHPQRQGGEGEEAKDVGPKRLRTAKTDFHVAHGQLYSQKAVSQTTARESRKRKRMDVRAQPLVPSLSPRRTRARSRSRLVKPQEVVPTASRNTTPESPAAAVKALKHVPESQVIDEFVAYSNDESEMHEVEANLQLSIKSRGHSPTNQMLSVKDLPATRRPQLTLPNNVDSADDDDDDELLEQVRKLDVHARSSIAIQHKGGNSDSGSEIFPFPRTRASDKKRRLTQAAKVAPYVPPRGTRAAVMIEKQRAREAIARYG
ncbi:hypothetical protein F5148DRAFT_1330937 [Russula earlei]|uniref:Uncharacterized protein n=1 Tax=Russula earlei TaxID=71964 RepID=A0ACC0TXD1_9AGAM|nr:hypothetical protein F5148DRAFT_1330937 [Russula earlei]